MNKVLLCTDCSPSARKAIQYALHFFTGRPELEYFLLSTYEIPNVQDQELISVNDSLRLKTKKSIQEEIDWLTQLPHFTSESITSIPHFGNTVNAIHRMTEKHSIDLIVAGTKGENAEKARLIGNTARSIIESGPCRKMIIPASANFGKLNKKMLLLDAQKLGDLEWWSSVTDLSQLQNYELFLTILPDEKNPASNHRQHIPSNIEKQLSGIADLSSHSSAETKQNLDNILRKENPDLLNIHVNSEEKVRPFVLEQDSPNILQMDIPFFINSFTA